MKRRKNGVPSTMNMARKSIPWIIVGFQSIIIVVLSLALITTTKANLSKNVCMPSALSQLPNK